MPFVGCCVACFEGEMREEKGLFKDYSHRMCTLLSSAVDGR